MDKTLSILALALVIASPAVSAAPVAVASSVDPNTFIVGHPASPRWKTAHSNGAHPAVIVTGRAVTGAPDSNRFLVQPPASVRWTTQPLPLVLAAVPR